MGRYRIDVASTRGMSIATVTDTHIGKAVQRFTEGPALEGLGGWNLGEMESNHRAVKEKAEAFVAGAECNDEDEVTEIPNVGFQCNNCGAHARRVSAIQHFDTCKPGESKRWEEYYNDIPEDEEGFPNVSDK